MKNSFGKFVHLILIVLAWPAALFILGAIVFTFFWVEHGSAIYVVVLCWIGLIIGLVHALVIFRRRKHTEKRVKTDPT
jgi:hypothetical protein